MATVINDERLKIQKASVLEANDGLLKNIAELILYRREIANEMLKTSDEKIREEIMELYKYSENKLRQLLLL